MGHYISGIVGPHQKLLEFAVASKLHIPAKLVNDLAFLPLSDDHLDHLFPSQGAFDDSMTYLSEALKDSLSKISIGCSVAYIETEYHGGKGTQGATVYIDGECVYEPITNNSGAISGALKILGITAQAHQHDEFEAMGFDRFRNNDDWIEEASGEPLNDSQTRGDQLPENDFGLGVGTTPTSLGGALVKCIIGLFRR
jgi:hypothetical protein